MKNKFRPAERASELLFMNGLSSAFGQWRDRLLPDDLGALNTLVPGEIPDEWNDAEYRRAAMEGNLENLIAWQVRINREERGMTQADLAQLMGTRQSAISKLEDPEGGDVLVSTLVRAAHAFDCALLVHFVEYGDFVEETADVWPERLFVPGFADAQSRLNPPMKPVREIKHASSKK